VINATFNNISLTSWWSVILMENLKFNEKSINMLQVTKKLYQIKLGTYTDLLALHADLDLGMGVKCL
jgi:hypothetical protein